jgi:hypothetical protein
MMSCWLAGLSLNGRSSHAQSGVLAIIFLRKFMKLKIRTLSMVALATTLCGCFTGVMPPESQHYSPGDSARIRLFGQNGRPSIMEVQIDPNAGVKPLKVHVGGSLGDAFGSLVGVSKNDSIGMAETENTRNLASRDGLASKAFYREFVIPADKRVCVYNAFIPVSSVATPGGTVNYQRSNCSSGTICFIPQAGKDYEVGFNKNGDTCSVSVFNIQTIEGKTMLVPLGQ